MLFRWTCYTTKPLRTSTQSYIVYRKASEESGNLKNCSMVVTSTYIQMTLFFIPSDLCWLAKFVDKGTDEEITFEIALTTAHQWSRYVCELCLFALTEIRPRKSCLSTVQPDSYYFRRSKIWILIYITSVRLITWTQRRHSVVQIWSNNISCFDLLLPWLRFADPCLILRRLEGGFTLMVVSPDKLRLMYFWYGYG